MHSKAVFHTGVYVLWTSFNETVKDKATEATSSKGSEINIERSWVQLKARKYRSLRLNLYTTYSQQLAWEPGYLWRRVVTMTAILLEFESTPLSDEEENEDECRRPAVPSTLCSTVCRTTSVRNSKTGHLTLITPFSGKIFHRQDGTCYGKSMYQIWSL